MATVTVTVGLNSGVVGDQAGAGGRDGAADRRDLASADPVVPGAVWVAQGWEVLPAVSCPGAGVWVPEVVWTGV